MLQAIGAGRRFGERIAVADVSFEIRGGEIFGLVGPNGAGKTTTLRMLAGLIPPTEGEIHVAGVRLDRSTRDRMRARIGFLTETPGLWEHLTVLDNLLSYARLFGVTDVSSACEQRLRAFGLWDRRADRAGLLSKGMKQKLALARALVHSPPALLLDEPTANLDPHTARDVRDLLLALRGEGCAIVVSSHNLDEVERVSDRVALINTRLIAMGSPEALRKQISGRRLRVRLAGGASPGQWIALAQRHGGSDLRTFDDGFSMVLDDPDAATPGLIGTLSAAGAPIREVFDERAPLEEVYLHLLGAKETE